jgi:hypothetical protein
MSRRAKFDTPDAIKRRIAEGRGQGDGPNYRSWYEVKDVPSKGRRHRIFCEKTRQLHHVLSDLERNCYYVGEDDPAVKDIKTQFPLLHLAETQEIARKFGYKHPRPPGGRFDIVMTTDQVWTVKTRNGFEIQAWSVKYRDAQTDNRVKEKHAIEMEYWRRRGVKLRYFSEKSVSPIFIRNWELVRPTLRSGYFKHFSHNLVDNVATHVTAIARKSRMPLLQLAILSSHHLGLDYREVLPALHFLIASRVLPVDLASHRLVEPFPLRFTSRRTQR